MRPARPSERRLLARALRTWRGPILKNGASRHRLRPERFNQDQLAIGTAVETEHTRRPDLAMEIAMTHLHERSDYYAKLERMERSSMSRRDPKTREPEHPAHLVLRGGAHDAYIDSNLYAGEKTWTVTTASRSRTFKTLRGAVMWGRAALKDSGARLERR